MFKKRIYVLLAIAMICTGACGLIVPNASTICANTLCSPQPYFDKCALAPIQKLLNSATKTIDIQMFAFTNYEPIISCIKNAIARGVIVRIYVDNQDSNNPDKIDKNNKVVGLPETELEKLGIQIRWEKTNRYMHRKIAIIDQEKFCIGSTNWSKNGFEDNREVDIILSNCEMACNLTKQFNSDWEKASETFK